MKIFSKIAIVHYTLGKGTMTTETRYYLFHWNYWTSQRTQPTDKPEKPQFYTLKRGIDGHLVVDKQIAIS